MRVIWWLNRRTERWLKKNLYFETWQLLGNGIAIDPRYVENIVRGMLDNGFTPKVDFSIS